MTAPPPPARPAPHAPLAGKAAVVTGASRGIGRAIAERLGRDGARVVVNYASNRASADEVVAAVRAAGPGDAVAVQADVGVVRDVVRLFDEAEAAFGRPDVVVNSAGVSVFAPHADVSEADFDRVFAVNAKGTFFVLQQAARRVADGGRIVYVSTGGTMGGGAGGGAYAGSKAPGEQFVMALAKELGPRGVTANSVSPGVTETDGLIAPRAMLDQLVAATALGRLGRPDDIADVVGFLAGPDGRWVTGQNIRATGGIG